MGQGLSGCCGCPSSVQESAVLDLAQPVVAQPPPPPLPPQSTDGLARAIAAEGQLALERARNQQLQARLECMQRMQQPAPAPAPEPEPEPEPERNKTVGLWPAQLDIRTYTIDRKMSQTGGHGNQAAAGVRQAMYEEYKASTNGGQLVALKVFGNLCMGGLPRSPRSKPGQLAPDEDHLRWEVEGAPMEFLREVRLLSELAHRGVVELLGISWMADHDDPASGGAFCMVLRYCEHGSLQQWMAKFLKGRPAEERAAHATSLRRWCGELLQAVAHCHRHGTIHRNIQPANLLLCEGLDHTSAHLRMAEFGCSRRLRAYVTLSVPACHHHELIVRVCVCVVRHAVYRN
jgi:serine/threonine protein kinase